MPTPHHGHCHEIEVISQTEARGVVAKSYVWPFVRTASGGGGPNYPNM